MHKAFFEKDIFSTVRLHSKKNLHKFTGLKNGE